MVDFTTPGCTPTAPSGVSSTALSETGQHVTWSDTSDNETGFDIYRHYFAPPSLPIPDDLVASLDANAQSFDDTGLTCGKMYAYKVLAKNARGQSPSGYSNFTAAQDCTLPATPTQVVALVVNSMNNTAVIEWNDSSDNESGFRVYRSTDSPNSFAPIGEGQVNEVAYFDHTAQCGHTEYYLVRAFNPAGESANSNTSPVTLPGCSAYAPSAVTTTVISQTQINLGWTDNSNGYYHQEDHFEIWRTTNPMYFLHGQTKAGQTDPDVTTFNDTGLTCGTKYYYWIKSVRTTDPAFSQDSGLKADTTLPCTPAAPGNLMMGGVSQDTVQLKWVDMSSNVDGFKIEKRGGRGGAVWAEVGSVPADTENFMVPNLDCGTA